MQRDDAERLWEWVVRLHRSATAEMDAHLTERFGHSLADYDVLHQLHLHRHLRRQPGDPIEGAPAPMRMGDLADALLIANSSCNRIVGRLERDGLVARHRDVEDQRVVIVSSTPAGRRLRQRMAAVHVRDIERLVGAAIPTLPVTG